MDNTDIAISVENLGKVYRLGVKEKIHDSFSGFLFDLLRSPMKNYKKYRSLYDFRDLVSNNEDCEKDVIWALKDVSFNVERGEVLGVIGRNGAGKSTLLKILSKITDPSSGRAIINGRVASLLEVGTGFHPELTGRENVYLNGTILGMRKKEVDAKFEEIVEFSGIQKFIDTPVKRYSSGMLVRLAFSVAAHLEPEILVIDEVLAVGDVAFQKKCLGKMENVAKEGRTILFVSHDMGAVGKLCDRVVSLEGGTVDQIGIPNAVISSYLNKNIQGSSSWKPTCDEIEKEVVFLSVDLKGGQDSNHISFGSPFEISILYEIKEEIRNLSVTYQVHDSQGLLIYESMDTDNNNFKGQVRGKGFYRSVCRVGNALLKPGRYYVSVASFVEGVKVIDQVESAICFEITEVGYNLNSGRLGVIYPVYDWDVVSVSPEILN